MSGGRRSVPLLALLVAIVVPFLAKDLFKPAHPARDPRGPSASPASSGREGEAVRRVEAPGPEVTLPAPLPEAQSAVEVNEDHLFEGLVNRRGKPVGFHSRPGGRDPQGARLVERFDGPNSAGVYTAAVEIRDPRSGRWLRKTSTFYPDRMDRAGVLSAVRNAFAHRQGGGEKFRGPSGAGFTIEGYFQDGRINTAYPIYSRR